MIRRIALFLGAALLSLVPAYAQTANTPNLQSGYFASAFSAVYAIPNVSPNTYTVSRGNCSITAQGINFFPFATNAPVLIADANTTLSEVLTPSAVSLTPALCGITISPANSHSSFQFKSGTGGLQEAINAVKSSASTPTPIILDNNWHAYLAAIPGASTASVISAAAGGAGTFLVDISTAPYTFYSWNGTAYALVQGKATATTAATAGAGSGATATSTGTGNYTTVALTTGTGTATGSIFTLTYPTTNSFTYAPACSIRSVGANVPVGVVTVASVYSTDHAVVTASVATTALAVSTAYKFTVTCQ